MGGGQLQVVALPGVGHRAAGQEGPPEEGRPAAGLLQGREVDMQRQGLRVHPIGLVDEPQLVRRLDGKHPLALPLRKPVKGQAERLSEQCGQPLGKGLVLCNDAYLTAAEGIAVQQHPVCLRLGTAFPAQPRPAQLIFYLSAKGHALTPQ